MAEVDNQQLWQLLLRPEAGQLAISAAVVLVLIVTGGYAIAKIRAKTLQQEPRPGDLLPKLAELYSRGELSEEEFRTIKTTLAGQVREELSGSGETG